MQVIHRPSRGGDFGVRYRDRNGERSRDRKENGCDDEYRDRYMYRDVEKEKEKVKREKERARERERERDRGKKRERDGREKERKERCRDVDHIDDDVRECDRKRCKREDDYKDKDRECGRIKLDRHIDSSAGSVSGKRDEVVMNKIDEKSRQDDIQDEQRKLDKEMEKRRRRVQEWQELKRTEEADREKRGVDVDVDDLKFNNGWTLEGESDDEAEDTKPIKNGTEDMKVDDEDEIDPLDAFMNQMVLPEVKNLTAASAAADNSDLKTNKNVCINKKQPRKSLSKSIGRIIPGEDSDSDFGNSDDGENLVEVEDEDDEEFMKMVKKTKVEKLSIVDHSKIDYPPFRKDFYNEVKEVSRMTSEEIAAYRLLLELKIHGKDVPKPIKTWHQTGLSTKMLDKIKKLNYEKPMSIQAQALPIIMSGRDCIGVAKTGSGKTLAFVLPMLRHIKDQPPLVSIHYCHNEILKHSKNHRFHLRVLSSAIKSMTSATTKNLSRKH